jgi:predicted RNA methylase
VTCFSSVDESAHYGASVAMLLGQYRGPLGWDDDGVAELGSGDASAIAGTVRALPGLRVRGFDISADSVERARENIAAAGVDDRYTVEVGDFFDQADAAGAPPVRTAIANPPYIPAPDGDILMPELWGGVHGNDLVLRLLAAGYEDVVVALASYADPVATVTTAAELGYRVVNFLAMGLDFGPYSSEPKVAAHIRRLVAEGRGWAGERGYMVAVTLFSRDPALPGDRAGELLSALQLPGPAPVALPVAAPAAQQRVA